jgi:uncharacterized membrane protein
MLAFSVGVYNTLLLFHILGAIVWVGGGVFVQIYATRLNRADQPERLAAFAKDVESLGQRVFIPASILVLIFGVTMVIYSPGIDFTDTWILLGLLGIVSTIVIGSAFIGPESGRLAKLSEDRSPSDPEVQRRLSRIFVISRIDLAVIVLVVADMVLKPGT